MENALIKNVLIVDDETDIRRMLQKHLQMAGYRCATAGDAEEALAKVRIEAFHLVISDIRMPGRDGLELMKEAKEIAPQTDFVIMTGFTSDYSYEEIIEAGAADFIGKPFEMGELKAKIERLQREKSTLRQLSELNRALTEHRLHLEKLVNKRTAELSAANERLRQEIEERRQAEEAARHAKEIWERTFDAVPDPIAILDNNYRIVQMNRTMAEKFSPSEATLGLTCYSCMHGAKAPYHDCPYTRLRLDGREHSLEVYEERLNGHFLVTVSPLRDSNGELFGAVHVARDITARKQMEDALRGVNDELEARVKERTAELAQANERLRVEIEERKRAENAVRESERFLQSTVDALSAHVAILDETGTIISVNAAWRHFAETNGFIGQGYGLGVNYLQICESAAGKNSNDALAVADGIRKVMVDWGSEIFIEYPCHSPTEKRWFVVKITRFAGAGPVRIVVAHEDITVRKRYEEQLLYEAFHDLLTGLPNRALFLDRLGHAWRHSSRRKDHHFAVLFLDLDHFKLINDSLGHLAGDQLLVAIARRIEQCARSNDTVARLGGDEFSILIEDIADAGEAVELAKLIQRELQLPLRVEGRDIFTTVSIGIALSKSGYGQPEHLLRDADTAMYRAKALGRNRHEIFDQAMHLEVVAKLSLETDLRRAIEENEFRVMYQPVVDLRNHRIAGFEALVRWQHPQKGLLSPVDFIPRAEETGLIVPIGLSVLKQACQQTRAWHGRFSAHQPLTISVNLSGRQLERPHIVEEIRQVLDETRFDPRCLNLEITESVIMENAEAASVVLNRIKDLGIRLSIDDFGTGYSSLSYLRRFPVDALKIDRSFVGQMTADQESYEIVRTIVALAHNLGMVVVAEGPETIEQARELEALGCEYAQGYFFARPMTGESAGSFVAHQFPAGSRPVQPHVDASLRPPDHEHWKEFRDAKS